MGFSFISESSNLEAASLADFIEAMAEIFIPSIFARSLSEADRTFAKELNVFINSLARGLTSLRGLDGNRSSSKIS